MEDNSEIFTKNPEFSLEKEKYLSIDNWVYTLPKILKSGDINYKMVWKEELRDTLMEKFPIPEYFGKVMGEEETSVWKTHKKGENDKITVNGEEGETSLSTVIFYN